MTYTRAFDLNATIIPCIKSAAKYVTYDSGREGIGLG